MLEVSKSINMHELSELLRPWMLKQFPTSHILFPGFMEALLILAGAGLFEVSLCLRTDNSPDISPPRLCWTPFAAPATFVPIWLPACCGFPLTFTTLNALAQLKQPRDP